MKNNRFAVLILLPLMLLLSACAAQPDQPIEGGYITGVTLQEQDAGENANFIINTSTENPDIGLEFWGSLTQGSVHLIVQNRDTQEIVLDQVLSGNPARYNGVVTPPTGSYDLIVRWDEPVSGSYNLEWQPHAIQIPRLSPMILLPGIGMLLVGLAFLVYGIRRGGKKYAIIGGLFWMGTVMVKFLLAAVFNAPLYRALSSSLPQLPAELLMSIFIGLLTGVTEILITWLFLRKTSLGKRLWKEILSFSLGFGALEAILLGAASLVGMIAALSMSAQMPAFQLRSVAISNDFWYAFAPVVERIFTIGIHLGCNVLLFYSVLKKEMRWFWASFALKSGIDAVAGFAQLSGQLESVAFLWSIEAFVILFGLLGFWVTKHLREKFLVLETHPSLEETI